MFRMTPRFLALFGALFAACAAGQAAAQAYPVKPVRMVVPLAAGGTGDTLARLVAERLGQTIGQNVVVENRPGANGQIGVDAVVKSAPDGYTLLMGSTGSIAINPGLYGAKLPFDPVRDLAAVTQVANTASILVVHPSLPVRNVKEFIALARSKSGELFYSSAGSGSTPHLNMALFASMAKIKMTHVPYKGSSPGRVALVSGETQAMVDGLLPSLPLIRAGKLRALGVTSITRNAAVPEVPTIAEAGLPGYAADVWYGILAPAAVPKTVVTRLNGAIVTALQSPELAKRLSSQGAVPVGNPPEQFAAFIKGEIDKWSKVVAESGAKPD